MMILNLNFPYVVQYFLLNVVKKEEIHTSNMGASTLYVLA